MERPGPHREGLYLKQAHPGRQRAAPGGAGFSPCATAADGRYRPTLIKSRAFANRPLWPVDPRISPKGLDL
ncbi:hypothetical protein SZ55_5351 [Pseudomonas sp. FeS53a]|nr:hypothetical protein SZ55_5351 [Pseudomonas sp. FeS53a]